MSKYVFNTKEGNNGGVEEQKRTYNIQKTNSKMANLNPTLS